MPATTKGSRSLKYNTFCYTCQTALELTKPLDKRYTNMIISVMLARQIPLLDPLPITLTPLFRYSCKLFVAPKKVKSFRIKQIQTLPPKYRGWEYICDILETSPPRQPFAFWRPRIHNSRAFSSLQPLSSLLALFCDLPSFVFNRLQPLLQKQGGWGGAAVWIPALGSKAESGPRGKARAREGAAEGAPRLKPSFAWAYSAGLKAPLPGLEVRGFHPARSGTRPGHDCVVPLQGSAYFFSICSFKCLAQASAVVCWPWRVFFLSTE
jgi:hypothetical protein